MREDRVCKTIFDEWIQRAVVVRLINRPVFAKFFWTEHKDTLVSQLEVLDDRQRLESFSQANAVRQDATVVLEDFVDGAFNAIALKLKKSFPNICVYNLDVLIEQATLFLIGQEILKDVEKGFEVDEFGGVVLIELIQIKQYVLLYVGDEFRIIPQLIEPNF